MADTKIGSICIVGVGGIGGVLAARLSRVAGPGAEQEEGRKRKLYFVVRGAHLDAIRTQGLAVRTPEGKTVTVIPDRATDTFSDLPAPDLTFVCVKGYSLQAAAEGLSAIVTGKSLVIPLLNGADIHERMRRVLKTGIVLPGCIYVSARILGPGVVEHVGGEGKIMFGPDPGFPAGTGVPDYIPADLFPLLQRSGTPYQWFDDVLPAVWTKYAFIAAFGIVTAASRRSIGEVMADGDLREKAVAIMNEIRAVASARHIELPPDVVERHLRLAASFPPATRTSYQRDIESGAPANEGDLFGGTLLRLSLELNVPVPVTAGLVSTLERSAG